MAFNPTPRLRGSLLPVVSGRAPVDQILRQTANIVLTPGDSAALLQIAALSVAFAGFAGLASVFRDRADQSDIKVDAGRLTNMLITSLSTTILSLIPLVPDAFFRVIVSLLRPHAPD